MESSILNAQSESDDDSLLNFRPFGPSVSLPSFPPPSSVKGDMASRASSRVVGIGGAAEIDFSNLIPSVQSNSVSQSQKGNDDSEDAMSKFTAGTDPPSQPRQNNHQHVDSRAEALRILKDGQWDVPTVASKIEQPFQLQWYVRDIRKPQKIGNKRRNNGKKTASKREVYPCRIVNEYEWAVFNHTPEIAETKTLIQYLGIKHKYKDCSDAVNEGRLIRFDGAAMLPRGNRLSHVDDKSCIQLILSEDHVEGYRDTLKKLKLTEVEQWMEVIMLERILKSVQDRLAARFHLNLAAAQLKDKVKEEEDEDDERRVEAAKKFMESREQLRLDSLVHKEENEVECSLSSFMKKFRTKDKLRVGDVICYFPPELVAVDSNLIREVTIEGIDPMNNLCVMVSNGRGLGKDVRIRRLFRIYRKKLEKIKRPYDCAIEEYQLVKGGSMIYEGFGCKIDENTVAMQMNKEVLRKEWEKFRSDFGGGMSDDDADDVAQEKRSQQTKATDFNDRTEILQSETRSSSDSVNPTAFDKVTDEQRISQSEQEDIKDETTRSVNRSTVPVSTSVARVLDDSICVARRYDSTDDVTNDPISAPDSEEKAHDSKEPVIEMGTQDFNCESLGSHMESGDHLVTDKLGDDSYTTEATRKKGTYRSDGKYSERNTSNAEVIIETQSLDEIVHTTTNSLHSLPRKANEETFCAHRWDSVSCIDNEIPSHILERKESTEKSQFIDRVGCRATLVKNRRRKRLLTPKLGDIGSGKPHHKSCSDGSHAPPPKRRRKRPKVATTLSDEQCNLVDEVERIMVKRWGNSFTQGLHCLRQDIGITDYGDRLDWFLKKDPSKLLRPIALKETEDLLRDWLARQSRMNIINDIANDSDFSI